MKNQRTNSLNRFSVYKDSFQFVQTAYSATDWITVAEAFRVREETMFRQMENLISRLGPNEKIILMGHNFHLSKNSAQLTGMWPSVGTFVSHLLPNQVYSIWMLYDHGSNSDLFCAESTCPILSVPNTINSILNQVGSLFFLPLATSDPRSNFIYQTQNFIFNRNQIQQTTLPNQADAIFFVGKVSPYATN